MRDLEERTLQPCGPSCWVSCLLSVLVVVLLCEVVSFIKCILCSQGEPRCESPHVPMALAPNWQVLELE